MVKAKTIQELLNLFEKAMEKALKEKEKGNLWVTTLETGRYKVSTDHSEYPVTCGRDEEGNLFVACQCYAALHEKCCYHGSIALVRHMMQREHEIKAKQAKERENPSLLPDTPKRKLERLTKDGPKF